MNKRQRHRLGRIVIVVSIVSVLGASGGWALSAPEERASRVLAYEPPTRPPLDAPEPATAPAERPKTRPDDTLDEQPERHLLAAIQHDMPITARPGGGRTIGTMPATSRFLGTPHTAWILEQTEDGRFGKVAVPYTPSGATGWIRLGDLRVTRTEYSVDVDLSRHTITVKRFDDTVLRTPAATGAAASPTPPGRYFVTDLAAYEEGGYLGSFAFGLSGIQPNLPAGWTGGDQLAIHGTNDPASIGQSTSAGCLRVSERALDRLKSILQLGTPVTIVP